MKYLKFDSYIFKLILLVSIILVFIVAVYLPVAYKRKGLLQDIKNNELLLAKLIDLDKELSKLNKLRFKGEKRNSLNLFMFVQNLLSREGLKDKLIAIMPSSETLQNGMVRDTLEIKLKDLYLSQLVNILYKISLSKYILIRELNIINNSSKVGNLDVKILLSYTHSIKSN